MSLPKIQPTLEKRLAQSRIVFWYDAEAEWWTEFDALSVEGVEKIRVQKNEFGVKHRIVRQSPNQQFLLYFQGQQRPEDHENWLLDLLLANGEPFSPDRATLALIDSDLPPELKPLVQEHMVFFKSKERVAALKKWLKPDDTEREVRLKMMAVACAVEPRLDSVLLSLLGEFSVGADEVFGTLGKFSLHEPLWDAIGREFDYDSQSPALLDFLLSLFRAASRLGDPGAVDPQAAVVFLNRWKDSAEHGECYALLSERADDLLNISALLNALEDSTELLENDVFRRVDLRLIADLRDALVNESLPPGDVIQRVKARASMHWARRDEGIRCLYEALAVAAEFLEKLPKLDLSIESFDAGLQKYATSWSVIDRLYRSFIHAYGRSGQTSLLEKLAARIEGLYVNGFCSRLASNWQEWVDRAENWKSSDVESQRSFYQAFVRPQVSEGRKVFVIVSDALRYEAGTELLEKIQSEDRWTAEIEPLLGSVPSFTQLGMASLLPHRDLEFSSDAKTILADGVSTAGTEARSKILSSQGGCRATALTAETFLALNSKTEGRALTRDHDVVFIYHDAIDAVGDKRDTEHKTSEAVSRAMEEILRILKKGAAVNANHFLVTADHGFLYQNEPVAESDFLEIPAPEGAVRFDRRFLVAPKIPSNPRLKTFSFSQLGLQGEGCVGFPKGIQRLRQKGSGSRYVHGGTSLQEVVVPVLKIRKDRASDTALVEVDIIRSGQQITTGQVTITFLQTEPVGEKCLPREIRAGFYSKTGVSLSESKSLRFDSTDEDARQRERREQFIFSREAEEFNQQEILLKLEEPIPGTAQTRIYREFPFKLRRAFESDFDDL
jgi:uncharacterized protein (TIGR02687 family)